MTATMPETILVVDDQPVNRLLLSTALADRYRVVEAESAEAALDWARTSLPDLVLLDISMPGIGGYGFLERWRQAPAWRDIPVICVTALNEPDQELQALSLGAVDYVTKPISLPTVEARVGIHLELRAARARIAAQNKRLHAERELMEEAVNRLRRASDFSPEHLRFAMSSVDRTNGDILLSARAADGSQWLLVGDVAGHGLPAALCAPLLSFIFYDRARRGEDFATTLTLIDRVMCEQLPPSIFMPCAAVTVDADRRRARLWNAGLPGCLLWRADDDIEHFRPFLVPMGTAGGHDLGAEAHTLVLAPGDRLVFFSDGLTEMMSADGRPLEVAGVIDFLRGEREATTFEALWPTLQAFRGGPDFLDDVTLVELRA